ncbi:MAG: metal ABC transporter substrate-binding protein [Candidatus Micrarchaeia archaeon]
MNARFFCISICLLLSCLLLAGCTQQAFQPASNSTISATPTAAAYHKPVIVVTTYFLEDFARHVAGDGATVVNLLPDGTNPHTYEPSPKDLELINSADIFVFNGAGLEPYAASVAKALPQSVRAIDASAGITLVEAEDKDHGFYDPHVWLDPMMAKKEILGIRNALISVDPANSAYYQERTSAYYTKLDELDAYIVNRTSNLSSRKYVGFHPAFTYFNARYNLSYAAVIEEFAGDEPSAQEMAAIVDTARATNITTIFAEPFLDPRAAQAIAKEINGTVLELNPLHTLTAEDRAEGKGYLSVMRENADTLAKVLS